MNESRLVTIGELTRSGALVVGDGYRTKRSEHGRPGYRIIRVADVLDDVVKLDGPDFVSEDYLPQIGSKLGRAGDVILTTKGTVGRVAVMPQTAETVVYSPQLCFFRTVDPSVINNRYLRYWFSSPTFAAQASDRMNNTDMAAYINLADIRSLKLDLPSIVKQRAIAEVLGALDDKIAANAKSAAVAHNLATTVFAAAIRHEGYQTTIADATVLLARGVVPKYVESNDGLLILNQKCIRNQRVDLAAARRTDASRLKHQKALEFNDVLVNSTGAGTLGRVARWTCRLDATVDSHVSILRFDRSQVHPVCAGFAVLRAERLIEQMGEGSTGQTELSRVELGRLRIQLPAKERQSAVGDQLSTLSAFVDGILAEYQSLSAVRDTLLPGLISGKIRVKDAEETAGEVL